MDGEKSVHTLIKEAYTCIQQSLLLETDNVTLSLKLLQDFNNESTLQFRQVEQRFENVLGRSSKINELSMLEPLSY